MLVITGIVIKFLLLIIAIFALFRFCKFDIAHLRYFGPAGAVMAFRDREDK